MHKIHTWLTQHSSTIIVVAILLLAAFFRLYHLSSLPLGVHDDEVWNTYFARYILENGTDLAGRRYPLLYVDKFGDYPPVLPMYLSGLASFITGVNILASRLPFAFCGILAVLLVYLITRQLFRARFPAYLAALFAACAPIAVILSRASAENVFASLVFLAAVYLLLRAFCQHRFSPSLLFSLLFFLLTYFLYPSYRVLVPLFLLGTIFIAPHYSSLQKILISATVCSFLLTLAISHTVWGTGRYDQVALMTHNDDITGRSLNYSLALGPAQVLPARIFYNKYLLAAREFARQYASYFSPAFLAGEGVIEPQRYALAEHGVAYWSLILVIIGFAITQIIRPRSRHDLAVCLTHTGQRFYPLIIWLLLISPLPGALTLEEVPNVHRTFLLIYIWSIIFATCSYFLFTSTIWHRFQKLIVTLSSIFFAAEIIYFWQCYIALNYESTFVYRDDAKSLLAAQMSVLRDQYEQIYLPDVGNLALFYLFETSNFDPSIAEFFDGTFQTEKLDNFIFTQSPCSQLATAIYDGVGESALAVSVDECDYIGDVQFREIDKIIRHNGTTGYYLYTAKMSTPSAILDN